MTLTMCDKMVNMTDSSLQASLFQTLNEAMSEPLAVSSFMEKAPNFEGAPLKTAGFNNLGPTCAASMSWVR